MKRPSFQFYPGDWLHDAALRTVSVGARGLWIEMLCYMHQGSTYGYLKVNHKVILTPNLARIVGATFHEVEGWLSELKDAGVYAMDEQGCIFSKRMIRDEEVRKARADGGSLGGNPALVGKNKVNLPSNLPPTPSSSSSSSSSKESTTLSGKPDVVTKKVLTTPKKTEAAEVLQYLNDLTGSNYRPVASNLKLIDARLKEGYSKLRLKEIAISKFDEWRNDDKMSKFLRPATLYNATNCAQYDGKI